MTPSMVQTPDPGCKIVLGSGGKLFQEEAALTVKMIVPNLILTEVADT